MKKTFKILIVLTLILLLCSSLVPVFGAQVAKAEATMTDVRNEEANISFGQYGKFNKRRTDINLENKTIDITLTVENDYVPPAPQNREMAVNSLIIKPSPFIIFCSATPIFGRAVVFIIMPFKTLA